MDLDGLNEAQRTAVTSGDGYHLVVAGAGTGKTRTLVHRVAWLIEQGVPAGDIVLLTFTRRAAREMLDRVAQMVGSQARYVRGGTFHAFANMALRRHAEVLGYPQSFTILDRGDAESLLGAVRSDLGYGAKGSKFARRSTVFKVVSKAINTGKPIADILEDAYPQYADDAEAFERIAEGYAKRKKQQGVMDFDDMLTRLLELLKHHELERNALSGAAQHVLVDEYQDTNVIQAQIAGLLSVVHGNLMVVGDEAQSIYAFRGAVVDNILEFPEVFQPCTVTVLEQNYRSVQPILDLANGVLDSAQQGYDKRLRSHIPGDDRPILVDVFDDYEQAETVVSQVVALAADGVGLDQQAVLFRSASHANVLEAALAEAGIPYRKFGGLKFTEAAHIKDTLALLRLVANPRDAMAWIRVLQWFPGLGAVTAQRISDALVVADAPTLDAGSFKGRKYHASLLSLADMLVAVSAHADELVLVVDAVVRWYRERVLPDLYDDWKSRLKDLDTFAILAERQPALEALLANLALDPLEQAEADGIDDGEVLTLSTIHSAKGLEWHTVYVLQLADGAFPSGFALDEAGAVEEERRLLYVAVTRARRRLYLMRPRMVRARYGQAISPGCLLLDEVEGFEDYIDEGRPTRAGNARGITSGLPGAENRLGRLLDWYGD